MYIFDLIKNFFYIPSQKIIELFEEKKPNDNNNE